MADSQDLLEEHKKKNRQNGAAAADGDDDTNATPGNVKCDACTGRKRKASMFCLVCLESYCEPHLKPHFEVPPLKKHNLIETYASIKESICGRHDKLLEVYCRTDQQFICLLCVMEEHKGHDTVAVGTQMCDMQRQLEQSKQDIADRVLDSERKMAELRGAEDSIRGAAWEECYDFQQLCEELIRSVKRKCSEMREKVGEAEKTGVDWTNSQLGQLKREVLELKRREKKLNQLPLTEDPIQFLQSLQALVDLPVSTHLHERLAEFVTTQTDKLKELCNKEKKELYSHPEENLLSTFLPRLHEEIPSRRHLLTKYKKSTLEVDPNTVAGHLCLSDRNREISWGDRDQAHPDHPDRFTFFHQALCKQGLQGSQYWEVEWDGGVVDLAVSYRGIERKGTGNDCCFGHNEFSWKLTCSSSGCTFWHNNLHKGKIPPALSRRVGIHLDYEAGTLSFYSVSDSDTLTRLHQIKTPFNKPLYPGFSVDFGSTLKICNM